MTLFCFSADRNCCEEVTVLSWEMDLAASPAGAGSSLATGEVLVPATEVTAYLPSFLKWKKGNIAKEEGKNAMERRQCKAKGRSVRILERKWLEKKCGKLRRGLNILEQD